MPSKLITAVCISELPQSLSIGIPFVSYTEGYQPTASRDSGDISRITYLTERYNNAVRFALHSYPSTDHLLIVDHYYLAYRSEIERLIADYLKLDNAILGASIWYWARRRIRPWIAYYDTTSAPEFTGRKWRALRNLPTGLVSVSGVGACWLLPKSVWEKSRGFDVPSPLQAGSSRCLDTSGYKILLDCDCRLWRTHDTNPAIPDEPMVKRIANTLGHAKRRVLR